MNRFLPLLVSLATLLAACGSEQAEGPAPSAPPLAPPLAGDGWIGSPVDPSRPGDRLRVLAFFKPT